jgi:hypothetical protein
MPGRARQPNSRWPKPVTPNDRFHLGSDTEAMTALLAAMFVEDGKLVRGLSSPEETIIEK